MYKLAAEEVDGELQPRIKLSDNPAKMTNPGYKKLYRIYDRDTGKAYADLIALEEEQYDENQPLTIFHPVDTWKRMTITNYRLRELLVPIFVGGKQVYQSPTLKEICDYAKREKETMWEETLRLFNPHDYKIDLSQPLYDLKQSMLSQLSQRKRV